MKLREAFADQARSCDSLGSPLTARICRLLGTGLQRDQGAVARRVLDWPGDVSSRGDSVPLRLTAALHSLVLAERAPALAEAYRRGAPSLSLLLDCIAAHEAEVLAWLDSPPQTNEVGRSAAIIAAAHFAVSQAPMPIEALELGTSAGLNLNFHRYLLLPNRGAAPDPGVSGANEKQVILQPEWEGEALPEADLALRKAAGVDLRPIDTVTDGERLLAYCWPDQPERLRRLQAALQLARKFPPDIAIGSAADWLEAQLASPSPKRLRFVFNTVAWQYFPPDIQARCEAALQQAGLTASAETPVAHFAMEADDSGQPGASLRLRLWNGQARQWHLGRADFHGRWIKWTPHESA